MKIENLTADCPKRFGICTFFQESCDVPPRQIHHTHRPNRGPCSRRSKARLGRGPLGRARGRRGGLARAERVPNGKRNGGSHGKKRGHGGEGEVVGGTGKPSL